MTHEPAVQAVLETGLTWQKMEDEWGHLLQAKTDPKFYKPLEAARAAHLDALRRYRETL